MRRDEIAVPIEAVLRQALERLEVDVRPTAVLRDPVPNTIPEPRHHDFGEFDECIDRLARRPPIPVSSTCGRSQW